MSKIGIYYFKGVKDSIQLTEDILCEQNNILDVCVKLKQIRLKEK